MPENTDRLDKRERLRRRAEELVDQTGDSPLNATAEVRELVSELRIYQAELEIQNEELEEAQEELAELHREYRDLYEFAPCGYLQLDSSGAVTKANLTAVKLLGKPRRHLIDNGLVRLFSPADLGLYQDTLRAAGLTGEKQSAQLAVQRPDGRRVTVHVDVRAERNELNEVLEWRVVLIDITDRVAAEASLRQSEWKNRSIMDNVKIGIALISPRMEILEMNRQLREWFPDVDTEQCPLCYRSFRDPPSDRICDDCPVYKTIQDGQPQTEEIARTNQNGECYYRVISSPIVDEDENVTSAIALIEDITETRRLRDLESRAERLEMAGTVAGQVAHDFNNLLGPLIAYPEIMREDLEPDHPVLAYVGDIEAAARKMAHINQDLLTMGRRGHYNQNVLDLNGLIAEAAEELRPYPPELVVTLDLGRRIMPVMGGEAQLHRMLANLLHNARDAVGDVGEITVTSENCYIDKDSVDFGHIPRGEYVKICVKDNGCGIRKEHVEKVFDPFFTTKTADRGRGSGLGMSVVHAVVNDHDGYIDLESKFGQGSTFYLYFPICRETASINLAEGPIEGSESVLVVDDDPGQRKVCRRILETLGYSVELAESGEEAIEILGQRQRDLVIIDMVMPGGIDGAETYRRILENHPQQKAIILSGYSGSDRVADALNLGAGSFTQKPVTRKRLGQAVRSELDR